MTDWEQIQNGICTSINPLSRNIGTMSFAYDWMRYLTCLIRKVRIRASKTDLSPTVVFLLTVPRRLVWHSSFVFLYASVISYARLCCPYLSLFPLMPREGCASWLWQFSGYLHLYIKIRNKLQICRFCRCVNVRGHPAICTQQSFNDLLLNVVFLIIFTEMLRFYKSGTNVLAVFIFWAYKLFWNSFLRELFEPYCEKTYLLTCAPTKTQISLRIRAVWSESSSSAWRNFAPLAIQMRQWRFWSDCANAQADLNLRWAHIYEGSFFVHCGSFEFACDFDCPVLN